MQRFFLLALLALPATSLVVQPYVGHTCRVAARPIRMQFGFGGGDDDDEKPRNPFAGPPPRIKKPTEGLTAEERERESLYAAPDFEFDATTVTALLGAAIAFNFFVLGNL